MRHTIEDVVNRYHIWDSRKILQLLPNTPFIDVTITSPPYWNLKDYGVKSQIGYGQKYEKYLDDLEKVFQAVYSLTTERGSLWIISDTVKHRGEVRLLPFDLAQRLKSIGWILQDIIIWNKDKTLPWSHRGKLRNIFEYITFFTKSRKFNYHLARIRDMTELREWWVRYPERYSPDGKAPAGTWNIAIPRQGSWGKNWVRHFNPLPPHLVERIILLTTNEGDVVLDPFCGSGPVLAQAHVMRRNYLGLDLNHDYRKMFKQRVLPAISTLYEQNSEAHNKMMARKKQFARLIRSLRKTKYPKEIIRLYRQAYGSLQPTAVLALQGSISHRLEIIFLFPHVSELPPNFLARAKELAKRPPLSKYGISTILSAYWTDRISQEWLKRKGLRFEKRLYLYSRGRTYAWAERTDVGNWLKLMRNEKWPELLNHKYPPIVSDVGVKVDRRDRFLLNKEE